MSPPAFQDLNVILFLWSCICGRNICLNLDDVASLVEVTIAKEAFSRNLKKTQQRQKIPNEMSLWWCGQLSRDLDNVPGPASVMAVIQTHNPVSISRAFCYILSGMWNLLLHFDLILCLERWVQKVDFHSSGLIFLPYTLLFRSGIRSLWGTMFMEEAVARYFQSKKGPFWEEVLFHPSVELSCGRKASSFWSDFTPKAWRSSRLTGLALKLSSVLVGSWRPLNGLN